MEIKEYFYRAFSDIRKDHDLPDDKTICKDILERAKKMKKNDNVRQVKFTEITPEYAEPKKSHKALNVFAGVAGTAAVLTGAVFGLNWLNEHGGLKGPDVQGAGAGYHEDVAEQLSADTTENNDILASFVYDDFTVNVTDYEFDGILLKVFYDVIFSDDCTLSSGEKLASVLPMAIFSEENAAEGFGELISETDNTQSCVYRETLKAYTEKLTVDFKPNEEGYAEFGGNPFTVYADHKKPEHIEINVVGKAVNGIVPMDKSIVLDDVTVHFTGYEFDSEVVTFYYDIIGTTRPDIRPMGINGAVFNGTAGTVDKENNMVKDCHGTVALYEPAETARISFGKDLTDLTDKSYTTDNEAFAVTVHFDPESVLKLDREDVYARFNEDFPDYALWMTKLLVTPTHITERLIWENGDQSKAFDYFGNENMRVMMNDGEIKEAHRFSIITADDGSNNVWLTYYFDEPIDTAKVSEVYFDEYRLYGEEIPKLSAGDSFKLDDGATAHIDYMHYDGFIFKTQITVHSDDPDYSTNKMKAKMSADPDDHVFLITGVELVGETGVAFSTGSDDKGCDVVYTYFTVLPENGQFHTGRIWDESADRDRTVGYIEYGGITDETTGYTRTFHTESEEYGTRDIIISPYGFKMEQSGSDYYLKSLHNQLIVVRKDGTVWYSGYDAAGDDSSVDDRQMLFGAFDEPVDFNDVYSLTFCGETFVLDDVAESPVTTE